MSRASLENEAGTCVRGAGKVLKNFAAMVGLDPASHFKALNLAEEVGAMVCAGNEGVTNPLLCVWAAARGKPSLILPILHLIMILPDALPPKILKKFVKELCELLKTMAAPDFVSEGVLARRREGERVTEKIIMAEDMVALQDGLVAIQDNLEDKLQAAATAAGASAPQRQLRQRPPAQQQQLQQQHQPRQQQGLQQPQQQQQGQKKCYECEQPGHIAKFCPRRNGGAAAAQPGLGGGQGGGGAPQPAGPAAQQAPPQRME